MAAAIAREPMIAGPPQTVGANFAWSSAGNAVYSVCQWGMVAVLAKLGTADMVGRYALGLAVTAPVLMLAQLNLRAVLATDVTGEHRFRDYLRLRLWMLCAALAAIAVLARAEGGSGEAMWAIAVVGLAQAVEGMSDIYHGLWQRDERMDRIAVSLAVRGVLSLGALGVVVGATGSLVAGLGAMLLARGAVLGVYDARNAGAGHTASLGNRGATAAPASVGTSADAADTSARATVLRRRAQGVFERRSAFLERKPAPRRAAALLWTALPLGVVLMMTALMTNMPRYFIAHHLGEASLGVFLAVATMAAAGNMMINALGQAAMPRLARMYADGDLRGFQAMAWKLAGAGALLGLGGVAGSILMGEWLLGLIYRDEYAAHDGVLDKMMMAACASYVASILGYAITAARCFRVQMPLLAIACVVTALAALWLVPARGLEGAAISVGAGAAAQALGEAWILRRAVAARRLA